MCNVHTSNHALEMKTKKELARDKMQAKKELARYEMKHKTCLSQSNILLELIRAETSAAEAHKIAHAEFPDIWRVEFILLCYFEMILMFPILLQDTELLVSFKAIERSKYFKPLTDASTSLAKASTPKKQGAAIRSQVYVQIIKMISLYGSHPDDKQALFVIIIYMVGKSTMMTA